MRALWVGYDEFGEVDGGEWLFEVLPEGLEGSGHGFGGWLGVEMEMGLKWRWVLEGVLIDFSVRLGFWEWNGLE